MTPILYRIPNALIGGYESGAYSLAGAILKDVATGRIVGHVQQTGLARQALDSVLSGVAGVVNPMSLLTSGLTVLQNEQIKSRLADMQSSLRLMQGMQIGTLALSGIGLGVSVVGFAVLNRRLAEIDKVLTGIEERLDAVTDARRNDEEKATFAAIEHELSIVDNLAKHPSPEQTAERASEALGRLASQLLAVVPRELEKSVPNPDRVRLIASAVRLCNEAGFRALLRADLAGYAEGLVHRQADAMLRATQAVSPDRLARAAAVRSKSAQDAGATYRQALDTARTSTDSIRQDVRAVGSQSELARLLQKRTIRGPDYLDAVEQEDLEPVMILPAEERLM